MKGSERKENDSTVTNELKQRCNFVGIQIVWYTQHFRTLCRGASLRPWPSNLKHQIFQYLLITFISSDMKSLSKKGRMRKGSICTELFWEQLRM